MATDFSAEYAACVPEKATPEYFSYMNSAGERMRKLDPAIRADTFIAISENYEKWQSARDSAGASHQDRDKLRAYLEMITRVRDQTTEQLIESAREQQRATRNDI